MTLDFRISRDTVPRWREDELVWAVVEPLWTSMPSDGQLAHLAQATAGQQALFSTMLFALEVDNGGILQFFSNSSGMYWRNVIAGLQLFGAVEELGALRVACDLFPNAEPPVDQDQRRAVIERITKPRRAEIQDSLASAENSLMPLWVRHIDGHPEDFFV